MEEEVVVDSAAGTAVAAATATGGPSFGTILTMILTLVSAFFTGNGEVTPEQEAALNAASPGLGSAFSAAVAATNGGATAITEWKAKSSVWDLIIGEDGIVRSVWDILRSNPILTLAGAWVAYRIFTNQSIIPGFLTGGSDDSYDGDY